jgi:hypothetical protein
MAEFATSSEDTYHRTRTCAPSGADQVLAEFAVAAGMTPCGVCGPREPGDAETIGGFSKELLVDCAEQCETVQKLADLLDIETDEARFYARQADVYGDLQDRPPRPGVDR